jgi:hypothetical protein
MVRLNWLSNVNYNYQLSRSTNMGGPFTDIGQLFTSGEISYIDGSVSANEIYYYKIDAYLKVDPLISVYDELIQCATTCILPGAFIETVNGPKLIEGIVSGDHVINEFGKSIEVLHNIKFGPDKKMVVSFDVGSLSNNLPKDKLSITYGHPIKLPINDGKFSEKEHLVQDLVNGEGIEMNHVNVDCTYALMTDTRDFVLTNGVPVATWSEDGFQEMCDNYKKRNICVLHKLL